MLIVKLPVKLLGLYLDKPGQGLIHLCFWNCFKLLKKQNNPLKKVRLDS